MLPLQNIYIFQTQCDINKKSTNIHLITSAQDSTYFKIYEYLYNFTLFTSSFSVANNNSQ